MPELPVVDPGIHRVSCRGSIVEDLVTDFLAAAHRQAQALPEEDRVVVVESVGRESVLFHIDMGETGNWSLKELAMMEIAGTDEVIF